MLKKIAHETYLLSFEGRLCSNIYLIENELGKILIDAGDEKTEVPLEPDLCILTHGHFDHTGGVRPGWKNVLLHEKEFSFSGPYVRIPKNAKPNPMKPLKFGAHLLEFYHTPGHTEGSICIYDKGTGLLFSGDTKFAEGMVGRTDLGGNEKALLESLALIEKIPYRLLCPGHGKLEWKDG
ncbi:MAG: MBL fold metallo-hydrolase [Candidatus Micrarchaeota archaeon]|nr:MBL fold metallo-hydrolase [Candidatus Micrarchaeota archaeon]